MQKQENLSVLSEDLHKIKMDYLTADANVQGHLHAGMRCAPTTKVYQRWFPKELSRLQDIRDLAKREWDLVKPSPSDREQRLIAAANGHEDLTSTQAARRICDKNNIEWKTA